MTDLSVEAIPDKDFLRLFLRAVYISNKKCYSGLFVDRCYRSESPITLAVGLKQQKQR